MSSFVKSRKMWPLFAEESSVLSRLVDSISAERNLFEGIWNLRSHILATTDFIPCLRNSNTLRASFKLPTFSASSIELLNAVATLISFGNTNFLGGSEVESCALPPVWSKIPLPCLQSGAQRKSRLNLGYLKFWKDSHCGSKWLFSLAIEKSIAVHRNIKQAGSLPLLLKQYFRWESTWTLSAGCCFLVRSIQLSVAICLKRFRMKRFIEGQQESDPLVNPVDKRVNPWAEKSKCDILWSLPSVTLSFILSPFVLMLCGSRPLTPNKWLPRSCDPYS